MKSKSWALVRSPLTWVLAVALVLAAPVPAAAAAKRPGQQIAASWGSYQPKGWSAGAVARGTGYRRPGASRRVREVQRRLDRLEYPTGPVDGFFGPITDAAVRQYQRNNALRADGIVGPKTLRDLRSRTRRAQGPVDRETSATGQVGDRGGLGQETRSDRAAAPTAAAKRGQAPITAVWSKEEEASSPDWWTFVLLLAAFAIALVGIGLLLRVLAGTGTAARGRGRAMRLAAAGIEQPLEPAATTPAPAGAVVTPISSRRRRSTSSPGTGASSRGPGRLRIERRIEQTRVSRSGRPDRSGRANVSRRRPPAELPGQFKVLGARIHLAEGRRQPADSPTALLVELELFVEGRERRWETGLVEVGSPFRVSLENLEESVRELVIPAWLPALADSLAEEGVEVRPEELAKLTFAIEPSIEVERLVAERGKVFPIAG